MNTRAIILWCCALLTAACVNLKDSPDVPIVDPLAALTAARTNLADATLVAEQQGVQAARNEEHFVVARFNPARCQCPTFEVLTAGVWTRSLLVWDAPEGDVRLEMAENKAREYRKPQLFLIRGRFTTDRQVAPNEIDYPVVLISAISDVGEISPREALKYAHTFKPSSGVPTISASPPEPVKTVPSPTDTPSPDKPEGDSEPKQAPSDPSEPEPTEPEPTEPDPPTSTNPPDSEGGDAPTIDDTP